MQGYLYVEAHKESHVTDATRGLRIIYHSKGARLVPLKEMVSAIYVNQQAKSQLGKPCSLKLKMIAQTVVTFTLGIISLFPLASQHDSLCDGQCLAMRKPQVHSVL